MSDLKKIVLRVTQRLECNDLIQSTINDFRDSLQVDRVVLYYFYRRWKGQVTLESFSSEAFSILGSTGADDCFNDEYAALYEGGRVRAIADVETESIHPCHQEFLRSLQIRANLVAPILNPRGLWGLLVAHHCQGPRPWSDADLEGIQRVAQALAEIAEIRES